MTAAIIFISLVIIHELGHIIMYIFYLKKFPSITFSKFGILYVGAKGSKEMTLRQHSITSYTGILSGLVYLALIQYAIHVNMFDFILIYIVCCFVDICNIVGYLSNKNFANCKLKHIGLVCRECGKCSEL